MLSQSRIYRFLFLMAFIFAAAEARFPSSVYADAFETQLKNQPMTFTHYSTEQGLSQANVNVIFQDTEGLMWFGTFDGLNKFDGYTFTVYKNDPADPASLSN